MTGITVYDGPGASVHGQHMETLALCGSGLLLIQRHEI
jgi:hypothetical protein